MYDVSVSVTISYLDTTARKVSALYLDTKSGEVCVSYLDTFKKYLWTPLLIGLAPRTDDSCRFALTKLDDMTENFLLSNSQSDAVDFVSCE